MKRDGADIWIDYARISGGDSLPEVIGNAIEWCDTMVLVWSKSAASSYFVKLEWTTGITNQKRIIPCIIDSANLPTILSGFLYLDFKNFERGYSSLARDLKLIVKEEIKKVVPQKTITKVKKPPIIKQKTTTKPHNTIITPKLFRNKLESLSIDDVITMLKKHNFIDRYRNENGVSFANQYELQNIGIDKIVIDHASGLMWQQGGSSDYMNYENAKKWIQELNKKGYAGYNDWRLPTLEEAMCLMERDKKSNNLYIDPIFDKTQDWIWTSDLIEGGSRAWVVGFGDGYCDDYGGADCVRVVRPGQSSD